MELKKLKLPKKQDQVISSYKIDKDLHMQVKKKLKKKKQSIHTLIETAFKSYVGEE